MHLAPRGPYLPKGLGAVPRRQARHLPCLKRRAEAGNSTSQRPGQVFEVSHLAGGDPEAPRGSGTCPGPVASE